MTKYAVLDSSNQVHGIGALPDGGSIIIVPDGQAPHIYDLWDGKTFSTNPKESDLRALATQRGAISVALSAAQSPADLQTIVSDLNSQIQNDPITPVTPVPLPQPVPPIPVPPT